MGATKMKGRRCLIFIFIITACSYGITAQRTECEKASVADIVFLVDGSSSIKSKGFQEAMSFLRNIIRALDIGPNKVRIGLAQYSDEPFQEFLLKNYTDKRSLLAAVDRVPYREGGTETGKAIDFLLKEYFTKEAGSRADQRVPQIAVIMTDGDSFDDVLAPAKRLKQHGVIVFAIGVGEANRKELEEISSWPPKRFLFSADSYEALERIMEEVLKTVCLFMEDLRQALTDKYADIFFLVDNDIAVSQFNIFRADLIKLVNQLNVGASTYRIGLAQYGQDVKVEFLLGAHKTKQDTLTFLRRFRLRPQPNQPRKLGGALRYARTHFFTSEAGGRAQQGSRQFLVVVSGKASDDLVAREAYKIETAGIPIVGMSAGASMDEIYRFASSGYAFNSPRVTLLKDIITTEVKEEITEDCKGANVADIVFVVDESGSIGPDNFHLVRGFLNSIVSGLVIGTNRVRVGIVTYNDMPNAQLYLNTFSSKMEILQFINTLPYNGGGTNTGAALNFTHEQIFSEKKGSRKGIQKVVVVITDGESQDSVSEAAAILRRSGVTLYAVGIKDANETELIQMASYPQTKHVFNVDSFDKLKPLKQNLQQTVCSNIVYDAVIAETSKADIKEACIQKDEADFYFLMDDSGSIQNPDFYDMKKFIIEFVQNFRIGQDHVRMGLVKYSDSPTLEFDLNTHSDAKSLEKAVESITHAGGGTETGKALSTMGRYFDQAKATRATVPQYLIVITDGESTDLVKAPAEVLRNQGVIIYAIGVKSSNQTQLQEIAGDSKKTFFVNNFDALRFINDGIITDICSDDACSDVPYDVIFLTDSSESIEPEDFTKMKEFVKSVISKSAIRQKEVHVGLMQYSTSYRLEFRLNEYYTNDEITKAIDGMEQMNEGTLTGKAITEVSKYFEATNGGRPDLAQRLVVITDGKAKDDVKGPAKALRDKGVVIYAIGVATAETTQLEEISGSSDRVFYENNFNAIQELDRQLALKLCDQECKNIEQADIIFLVDGSGSINDTDFFSMKKFMNSVVNKTTVGKNLTNFGVILYADEPQSVFSLNQYFSKQGILQAITDAKQPWGNTYTGKALEYSLQFFNAQHGGRKALKVPQILMVITDGDATDPQNLKSSSDALRKNGVTVFSIGVKEAKREELEIMAGGDSSKVFYVDNFEALETLYKNISSVLCNSTKQVCKNDKVDLVFLLDQSGSITPANYTMMINFTIDVVKSFEVSEEFVHVGLAQFSDDLEDGFYLNGYTKEEDVITHIHKIKQKGGGTYLGNALNHIAMYFEPSRGSRRTARIPQNLVLITDGDSHDDVEEAAQRLKAMKVEVFAVGVGDVHDLELLQITGTPQKLFSVRNFNMLANIKKKVVDTICNYEPIIEERHDCTMSIAMGFDISQKVGVPGEVLVSGHKKLEAFLPEIVQYVSSLQGLCCLGQEPVKPRIAFNLIDVDGTTLEDTRFEDYEDCDLKKVMSWPLHKPTYFNTALLDAFKKKFEAESKEGVKVLVIFSDGLDEDVMKLEHESELLQKSGVNALLTVALEGARNPRQLQMVEFGRGFDYRLPLTIGMPSVGSNILKQIDTVAERECCNVTCKCSGHEGIRGIPGTIGTKGLPGLKGQPGFPGEEGIIGDRGPPGPSGPQGIMGCPGASGQKGFRGISGNRGENGEDGLDGIDGEQGVTGLDGARGESGNPGNPGIPGIAGEGGQKGDRGLRGDLGQPGIDNTTPGAKGDPGHPGVPGLSGPDGQPGEEGDNGNQGPDGRRGPDGEKGADGPPGARGLPGIPGAPGPQGRRGGNGENGPEGMPGFPGLQGEPGSAGQPGTLGRHGSNGQKGQQGDSGIKGAPGAEGPRGLPGVDGRDVHGPSGLPGTKGDPGFPGYPGLQGENGLKGTKGYSGPKGSRGRGGNSGRPGESGKPGEPGHPGHKGPRGPPGSTEKSECELITHIRDNCACCSDHPKCPAYATELVFGLDMSQDVTPAIFDRQRSALLSLLEDVSIAESNCPSGARVAVVGYSTHTKYLIRFHDYRRKNELINAVKNLALERTSNQRHLGAAMRFVAHNVFKRVRAGAMMRKVAVFITNGPSQNTSDIITAIMEYQALNINPAVISMRNAPDINQAFEVDDTRRSIFTVLGRQQNMATDLRRIKNCAICYDPCRRGEECLFIQDNPGPQRVDMDLVMVVDSSREMQADEYAGVKQLLGSVVEQLAVSDQPRQARVALVQSGSQGAKLEFGLETFQNQKQVWSQIQKMQQQGGSSVLGRTLEFTLNQVLLKANKARRRRSVMAVVGSQTISTDRMRLQYISQKAKCEGVALFVVTVGNRYSRTQVEELASQPEQQHLIHLERLKAEEQGYAQRFFRVFLSTLNKQINTYPPPSLKQTCDQLTDLNGEGSAELEVQLADEAKEMFQMEMGGKTWTSSTRQLDVVHTVTAANSQSSHSGANLKRRPHNPTLPVKKIPQTSSVSKDACSLSQDTGSCQNYTVMWFFDNTQGKCSRFWYGGCGGNDNRFKTRVACENLCLNPGGR